MSTQSSVNKDRDLFVEYKIQEDYYHLKVTKVYVSSRTLYDIIIEKYKRQ